MADGQRATVATAVGAMQALAPPELAASWDRVGLRWGRLEAPLTRVLVAIDLTAQVLAEARTLGAELIVAYHPPLWEPCPSEPLDAVAQAAIAAHIAAYSPHTAWDAAPGGANDLLADLLGLRARRPLLPAQQPADLVLRFTAPAERCEAICRGLEAVGCGQVGAYGGCSFRSSGVGSFRPLPGAQPHIGEVGQREQVAEEQVEMRVPVARRAAAAAALRAHHPYEQPAFVFLAPHPDDGVAAGMGRVGATGASLAEQVARLKEGLGVDHLLVALPPGARLAACPGQVAVAVGAGGSLIDAARGAGAGLFVTGELDHHRALAAAASGMAVVATLHSHPERYSLAALAARLAQSPGLAAVEIALSTADREPYQIL